MYTVGHRRSMLIDRVEFSIKKIENDRFPIIFSIRVLNDRYRELRLHPWKVQLQLNWADSPAVASTGWFNRNKLLHVRELRLNDLVSSQMTEYLWINQRSYQLQTFFCLLSYKVLRFNRVQFEIHYPNPERWRYS